MPVYELLFPSSQPSSFRLQLTWLCTYGCTSFYWLLQISQYTFTHEQTQTRPNPLCYRLVLLFAMLLRFNIQAILQNYSLFRHHPPPDPEFAATNSAWRNSMVPNPFPGDILCCRFSLQPKQSHSSFSS